MTPNPLLVTLLALTAIAGVASAIALGAGVLSRLAGSSLPAATLTAGAAFAGAFALLLSVAVAVGLL
jgi:hypothetical protein